MSRPTFRPPAAAILCAGFLAAAMAAVRPPGKYNGVVFYDRWDNCYLFSGVYLMYISDSVKDVLRPYQGKSMEIDATEVHQPMNPGDGVIKRLGGIGESKEGATAAIRGVDLRASVSRVFSGRSRAVIEVRNNSSSNIQV